MALEIEKKFLVKGDYKACAFGAVRICQGYLCSAPERSVRVRIRDGRGFLTIKGSGNESGAARFEWEKEIPLEDARELLKIAEPGAIEKTRYLVHNSDGIHTLISGVSPLFERMNTMSPSRTMPKSP